MNQSVQSGFEFYECAVLFDLYDFALENIADLVLVSDKRPWLRLCLLESEADLAFFFVERKDLDVDDVADLENFFRVFELAP